MNGGKEWLGPLTGIAFIVVLIISFASRRAEKRRRPGE